MIISIGNFNDEKSIENKWITSPRINQSNNWKTK